MEQEKITVKAIIFSSKQKVWDYYTKPEHITKWNYADPSWHCPWAINDLKIGGRYVARMESKDGSSGFDFEATYTEIKEGESFSYKFGGRFATVEFKELSQSKTEVIITFDPETVYPIEVQKKGWQSILDNFKKYTEAH
jgi:uncharacterized protein YndB with AHSA1/START domain